MKLGWLDGCIAAVVSGAIVSVLAASINSFSTVNLAGGLLLIFFSYFLLAPVDYSRTAADFEAGRTKRKPGPIPPPFPNSWYVFNTTPASIFRMVWLCVLQPLHLKQMIQICTCTLP
jgi:hypothetical protein